MSFKRVELYKNDIALRALVADTLQSQTPPALYLLIFSRSSAPLAKGFFKKKSLHVKYATIFADQMRGNAFLNTMKMIYQESGRVTNEQGEILDRAKLKIEKNDPPSIKRIKTYAKLYRNRAKGLGLSDKVVGIRLTELFYAIAAELKYWAGSGVHFEPDLRVFLTTMTEFIVSDKLTRDLNRQLYLWFYDDKDPKDGKKIGWLPAAAVGQGPPSKEEDEYDDDETEISVLFNNFTGTKTRLVGISRQTRDANDGISLEDYTSSSSDSDSDSD